MKKATVSTAEPAVQAAGEDKDKDIQMMKMESADSYSLQFDTDKAQMKECEDEAMEETGTACRRR
jgi:hypothetical protein